MPGERLSMRKIRELLRIPSLMSALTFRGVSGNFNEPNGLIVNSSSAIGKVLFAQNDPVSKIASSAKTMSSKASPL